MPKGRTQAPAVLMLSHCVPDPVGGADHARAWQLLEFSSQHTRVHLLCLCDGPVHLAQWRAVSSRAVAVKIVTPQQFFQAGTRLGGWVLRLIQDPFLQAEPGLPLEQWLGRATFDAVVCTAPQMEWRVGGLDVAMRLCDQPRSHLERVRGLRIGRVESAQSNLSIGSRLGGVGVRDGTANAGRHPASIHHPTIHIPRTIQLPDLPDVRFLRDESDNAGVEAMACPNGGPIVLHGDWTRPRTRKQARSLSSKLRPLLHAALPQSGPFTTEPDASGPYALDLLRWAQFVVCLGADAHTAAWSTMQALALAKSVITDPQTALGLGVEHNRQVLICESETEVVSACLRLLDDPQLRRALSTAAGAFADRHFVAHPARARFGDLFTAPGRTLRPVAAAA